ncbi:hypothetical protein BKCO1_7800036 [Neofusicoccum parvum]|uniref:Uncharacterized protein n=1 Tax=Neofusicoccum parvum TaxID=310453 RepID=A0ACB5SBN2_9PEZI|nr:hypothetical protein BKCO1_7800036 [Neofusicoccum parvum]
MLIVLLLRLASLAIAPASTGVFGLLEKARGITYRWITRLRAELHQATTSEVSQKLSRQILWAALLYRRACSGAARIDDDEIQPEALHAAIEASMAVHENFPSDLVALPDALRLAVLRDVRARGRISGLVRAGIERWPGSLTAAVNGVWPSAAAASREARRYSPPEFVRVSSGELVVLRVDWQGAARRQTLHYDPVGGGLWIDYKPLSQLPAEYRDDWTMKELFSGQHLLTYPSYMPGMEYMLNFTLKDHEIHFGTHEKRLVIRARYRGQTLEFLPCAVFGSLEKPDLPASLVENCIQKKGNWAIDVRARLARRHNVFLVDPASALFDDVAAIFRGFENRARLTVFQPESRDGGLSVELRRLDLSFVVKDEKEGPLLYCRELHAVVDPDQDAGTWYGFDSKVVLRDALNPQRRSILVPLGLLSWNRRGKHHVAVHAENGGTYGIYTINAVLGRLDCPAKARLLLFKALLHAYTASIAPDPLTRRTGTEEALHCLRSAQNQPWMPLNPAFEQYLNLLAGLAPKRVYYPPGKKVMQQVFWVANGLPAAAQHEAFVPAVAAIY